jgi:type I restriction enzyme R subunit
MINKNSNRIHFSERYRGIIHRYNAGGSENEDFYEQLIQLIEELQKESERPTLEGLSEEELEIYDLLIKGKKLTKSEEQKVKLASKNLFKKLSDEKRNLLIVDWFKDEQPVSRVKKAIEDTLDKDLPDSYDTESFASKTNLILSLLIDKAVQGLIFS